MSPSFGADKIVCRAAQHTLPCPATHHHTVRAPATRHQTAPVLATRHQPAPVPLPPTTHLQQGVTAPLGAGGLAAGDLGAGDLSAAAAAGGPLEAVAPHVPPSSAEAGAGWARFSPCCFEPQSWDWIGEPISPAPESTLAASPFMAAPC